MGLIGFFIIIIIIVVFDFRFVLLMHPERERERVCVGSGFDGRWYGYHGNAGERQGGEVE